MPVSTPAKRANARRDPAVLLPPAAPRKVRDLSSLNLQIDGVPYLIGPHIDTAADNRLDPTIDGACTLTLTVSDPDEQLTAALIDETMVLEGKVRIVLDETDFVLLDTAGGGDERQVVLTFHDRVAWQMGRMTAYLSSNRGKSTDGEFIYRLVSLASTNTDPIRAFIPELREKLKTTRPDQAELDTGGASAGGGLGDAKITVKGVKAKARQRRVLDDAIDEARTLGASRRVCIALVMALTQESGAGVAMQQTGNDDVGYLQQGREWISAANARKIRPAVRAFLLGAGAEVGGTGGTKGWKQRHGSIKNAPGDLNGAIKAVQISVGGYAPWEKEATKTVDAWLGGDSAGGDSRTYVKTFRYHAGQRGNERENWWTATGRMASDEGRGKLRWALQNTLFYVSEAELAAAAPSLVIHGDEGFIVQRPSWKIGVGRRANETSMTVLSERWAIQPGAVVELADQGLLNGRWLVAGCPDDLTSPETDVSLRRPRPRGTEPAPETGTVNTDDSAGGGADGTAADRLYEACKHIDSQNRSYSQATTRVLDKIQPDDPLDCSNSCALALKRAGMYDGDTAIVSGEFARTWGKAGKGRTFTVWANAGHVFIIGYDSSGKFKWRFDTGGGMPRGPHLRDSDRDTSGFTAKHWPGT